jgi:hypothetical protein
MKTKIKEFIQHYLTFPKYILFHPFDGYEAFKRYKKGRLSVAIVFMILFAMFRIFSFQYEGYLINPNNPNDLNSIQEIISVFLLIFLFTAGNWSVTTLMEGKGKYVEIFMVTGYALFPLIVIGYPSVILSNLLTSEEMAFYGLLMYIAYGLSAWMLFMGILNIHQYGLGKTIGSLILTVVSMSVLMFVGLLFFDLIQQFISFIASIYEELSLRS